MKKLTTEDPETKSPDLVAENIDQLKALFPEAFTEGKVDFEVLKQLLGGAVEEREEKYGLNWHGKRRARQLALSPSIGTLRPCPEDSVDWDTTRNLMIEGDNLEVLKLLQKSYSGKVKLIYIDPPYNTGKEFVYPDNFQDNIRNYLELTGQVDGAGRKLSSNTEASGRFHTDWLNMMYPRLKLARNLLRSDGAIFISIDDGEVDNLKKICNEIFYEENFIAQIAWKKKTGAGSGIQYVFDEHEYVLVYARNKEANARWRIMNEEDGSYKNPDNDERGNWESCAFTAPSKNMNPNQLYLIEVHYNNCNKKIHPFDKEGRALIDSFQYLDHRIALRDVLKTDDLNFTSYDQKIGVAKFIRRWAYAKQNVKQIFDQKRVYFNGGNIPRFKKFEIDYEGKAIRSIYFDDFSTQQGTDTLRDLFGESYVEYPKPVKLIKHFVQGVTQKDDVVLDFFAGSGTTGHAVMAQNSADRGKRQYILVQLPEPLNPDDKDQKGVVDFCDKLGKPCTIAELTKERLRRAGKKIKEENPLFAGDLGFRVFKLASSNIRTWEPDRENLAATLKEHAEHLKTDRTEADLLFELLLKLGLDLTVPIEQKTIAGKTVHSIGAGTLLVCLSPQIAAAEVEPLALGIVAWHKQLGPAGETQVVFRDSAFADDVAKTNLTAILQQHGLENVRSL